MERLTKKLPDGRNILTGNFAYVRNPKYGSFVEGYAVDKLAEYEDAEEQGLLLRLPCAVDSTVYLIKSNGQIASRKADMQFLGVLWGDYGKEWFLNKAEAEKALKQMGE